MNDLDRLLQSLKEERDYLILSLGGILDNDELLKETGKLYELGKVIELIEKMKGGEYQ